MLKNLKMGLSLLKYGFNIKQNIVMCSIFFVLGIIIEVFSKGTNVLGAFYIVLVGMFVLQMILSMNMSSLVASSSLQKSLQTTIPAITNFIVDLVFLTIVLVIKFIFIKTGMVTETDVIMTLTHFALLVLATFLYCGVCYKFFLAASIGFIAFVLGENIIFVELSMNEAFVEVFSHISFYAAAAACYGIVVVGALIQFALAKLLYKHPFSRYAFKSILQNI